MKLKGLEQSTIKTKIKMAIIWSCQSLYRGYGCYLCWVLQNMGWNSCSPVLTQL